MMKQMPKDTILFIDMNNKAVAYDYSYFTTNFNSPSTTYTSVFYKAGYGRDTWIDYKKAIQCKAGSRTEKIRQALADEKFLVNFVNIPSCYYYSAHGIREYFTPYDGYYDNKMWLVRDDMHLNLNSINRDLVDISGIDRTQYVVYYWSNEDLVVEFPDDVTNAVISLNMLFLYYEQSGPTKIIYRGIKQRIPSANGYNVEDGEVYDLKFNVYRWKDLIKQTLVVPKGKNDDDNFFEMPVEMEQNAFIFYNGVFYTYEVNNYDKRFIRINGIETKNVTYGDLDNILVYRMMSNNPEMEALMYIHCGVNNRYKNSVDFLLPVCNSIILYNGVDHEYLVEEDNAIAYPNTTYSLAENVTYLSDVLSVNFTKV